MTKVEDKYCRGPLASMINKMPKFRWIPNRNIVWYERGRPDGFIFSDGKVLPVECKAGFEEIDMGNPADHDDGSGWSYHQRQWRENNCVATDTPYAIAAFIHPDRDSGRILKSDSNLFLIPPKVWISFEGTLESRMAQYTEFVTRMRDYALEASGDSWVIPNNHQFFDIFNSKRTDFHGR